MNTRMTVGISISEPDLKELAQLGMSMLHLEDAMVETARYLLSKGYNLAYGGDLSYEGAFNFTELLLQLGQTYGGLEHARITNYAAFPLYTKISRKREAELVGIAKIIRVNPSREFDPWLNVHYDEASAHQKAQLDEYFDAKTDRAKQVWGNSLTAMRRQMTEAIGCRVVMGGRRESYKGWYPGVWEEAMLCVENNIPLIVDDRFGGAADDLMRLMKEPHSSLEPRMAEPRLKAIQLMSWESLGEGRIMIGRTARFADFKDVLGIV